MMYAKEVIICLKIFMLCCLVQQLLHHVLFIYLITKKQYTHSSLSIEDDLNDMFSFCRIYPRLPLPAGLSKESLYRGFYDALNFSGVPSKKL